MSLNIPSLEAPHKTTTTNYAELLSRYVQIPSISGNEKEAGRFWSDTCQKAGLKVQIFTDEQDSYNFAASLYPLESRKPNIVFINHIDVVPPGNSDAYKHPPFSGAIDNNEIWGRGAIDNKGMAVMQLGAVEKFIKLARTTELPDNITLLSVSGEETGGHKGAKVVSEQFLEILNPSVVFGEGGLGLPKVLSRNPDMKVFGIAVSAKRRLWLELKLGMNTSGHGSVTPHNYVVKEKIFAMNNLLEWERKLFFSKTTDIMFSSLGKLEGGIKGFILKNLRYFKPFLNKTLKRNEIIHSVLTNTITIIGVNTPAGPPNQIPQEISVILDCRLLPDIETNTFIEELKEVMDCKEIQFNIILEDKNAKASMPELFYSKMEKAIKDVFPGSEVIPIISPASDDNHFFRYHGIPVYGLLPVFMDISYMETVHNVNERLPLFALQQGIDIYAATIKNILN